jgi:hypothetical protein
MVTQLLGGAGWRTPAGWYINKKMLRDPQEKAQRVPSTNPAFHYYGNSTFVGNLTSELDFFFNSTVDYYGSLRFVCKYVVHKA